MSRIPVMKECNGIPTMYVENKPFFAFAGEVHNSSAGNLEYMNEHVWDKIQGLNLNTLLVPVYWEQVEPEEGSFRYEMLDGLIEQARQRQMRLILLWFGLWKNAESMYVPGWMKKDSKKYFRVRAVSGEMLNTISPFCTEAVEKDAAAFANVMEHIRQQDEEDSTVIAVQIENEVGLLGTAYDVCDAAREAFEKKVPDEIAIEYGVNGTWKSAFGEDAGEYFMAYYFARALEHIASNGKEVYPLPFYTNVWLKQYPWYAGSYPSGGPVRQMHRMWKIAAPSLFTLAPDIYVPYTAEVMEEYSYEGNPLFIPEVRKDAATASYCLYAFMKHHAICYSPFGIEDLGVPPEEMNMPSDEVMAALNINPLVFDTEGGKLYLSKIYELLYHLQPLYLRYRGTDRMQSYVRKSDMDSGVYLRFRKYNVLIEYMPSVKGKPLAAGVIFELEEDKFLIAGMMSKIFFHAKPGENVKISVLTLQEGRILNGEWAAERTLNGDEQMMMALGDLPSCLYVELFRY